MTDRGYPVVMIGGVPVVNAPQEIDITNTEWFRKALLHAARRGQVVVVNMAGTRFCDSSGIQVLAQAHERATRERGHLLLVIPATSIAVLRVFALTGLDRVIPAFQDLNQALDKAHAVIPRPLQRPVMTPPPPPP